MGGAYFVFLVSVAFYFLKIRPAPQPVSPLPSISILKPLKGIDDELVTNLKSFFELDYQTFELIFGVSEETDPAIPLVRSLQRQYSDIPSRLVIDDTRIGLNPKINNLYNMYHAARYDHILISDSNTRVVANYLTDLVTHLNIPDTGLVTSTIRGVHGKKIGSILENLHLNSFIAPNVFAVDTLINLPISIGKSMLMHRQTLEKIGGFFAFRNLLAEDHLMGVAIKELGMKVVTTSLPVNNVNQNWSVRNFYHRHLRWAKLRKNINRFYYLMEIFSNPIALALLYSLFAFSHFSLMIFLSVTTGKILLDVFMNRTLKADIKWHQYFLIPVKDLLISFIWLIPFFSTRVTWRGNSFKISRNTQLIPIWKG